MTDQGSSDPYAPIEGVSLEQYTKAAVAVFGLGEAEAETEARAHGIPAGRMLAIGEEWSRRMTSNPEMALRYNALYQQAMKDAGVVAPDITLEQYAEILKRGKDTPLEVLLPEFGLNLQTWALVSGSWGERMMADPTLAVRFAKLLGAPIG